MKFISFKPEFIPLIKNGKKTVTRRINTRLRVGDRVYFKATRIGKKEGYLDILDVFKTSLFDCGNYSMSQFNDPEIKREGFESIQDFAIVWNILNKKGAKFDDNPKVYRIEFEYIGKDTK